MSAGGGDRTVLVTGGTGHVGAAIVEALVGVDVITLSRHGGDGWSDRSPGSGGSASGLLPTLHGHVVAAVQASERVRHVVGDITLPDFGMDRGALEELAAEVDVVVHCAGVSDFTTPRTITNRLNVEGTRHAVAFTALADAPLYHISTGYVESEGTSLNGRWGAGVYIESKREAEDVARASELLAGIIRPSIVFGDSRTGASTSFQGLHRVIGMLLENKIPLLPFGPETRVDFLPKDIIGEVTARLVLAEYEGEYWLTAGSRALRFDRIVELLLEYGRGLGLELDPPRFVSQEMIDRLIRPVGGRAVERRIDLLLALTTHFASSPELPSSLADDEKGDLEGALMLGARHWAREQGLDTAEATT